MPNEPKIEISEVEPGEAPLERAAVELSTELKFRFYEKNSREKVIEKLKAARDIPLLDQEYILARIAAIPEEHGILQVSIVGVPHKAGFNFTFTACELT
jgi:predicted ATP-dependent Lon-type protease